MSRISALIFSIACLIIGSVPTPTAFAGSTTLDRIKAAGSLSCGINTEEPEYSTQDAHGNHSVFDVDICKAVAVAVLGANAKFTVVSFRDEQDALKALKSGEIALLATGSPPLPIRRPRASASRGPSSMTTRAFL
jgi:general L-amino acid transport system substrate-binding protein